MLRQRSWPRADADGRRASSAAGDLPPVEPRRGSSRGRTPDAPVDLGALVRERYYRHLCVQMLSSDAAPVVLLLGFLRTPESRRFAEAAFAALLLAVVCLHAAAALAFPLRRWAPPAAARALPRRLRAPDDAAAVGRALLVDWAVNLLVTPALFGAFLWRPDLRAANCPDAAGLGGCGLAFISTIHLSRSFRPVVAQVPPRLAFAYELARAALTAACALLAYAADGALGAAALAAVLARSAAALAFTLALISAHHDPTFSDAELLPPWLDLWPAPWRPAREAALRSLAAAAARLAPMPLDHRVMCGLNVLGNTLAGVLHARAGTPLATLGANGRIVLRVYLTLSVSAAASAALSGGGTRKLGAMARRLGLDAERELADEVRLALAEAPSEAEALRAAAGALRARLFPRARALALRIALAGDEAPLAVALGAAEAAAALRDEGDGGEEAAGGSRAFVAAQDRCLVADSRDFPAGLATFADWARAGAAGADVVVTAPLPAGPALLGTLVASFGAGAAPERYERPLLATCRAIGEGLFARRELATASAASALASDVFPSHVVARLLERSRRASGCSAARLSRQPSSSASLASLAPCDAPGDEGGAAGAAGAATAAAAAAAERSPSPRRASPPAQPGGLSRAPAAEQDEAAGQQPRDPAEALRRRRLSDARGAATPAEDETADADAHLFCSEAHECVTVVFVDLVDFTPLAESQEPMATMQMLHALFSRYDDVADALDVYKLETVGDCYVAVAGLTSPEPAAAEVGGAQRAAAAAALFALRALSAAAACGLRARAGVHSGAVTSGLVGRLRARYCLFGDTMNTAARLEAAGAPGCAQLSQACWRLAGLPDALSAGTARSLQLKGKAGTLEARLLDAHGPEAAQLEALLLEQLRLRDDTDAATHAAAACADT
jgi:class 3 adenylate cyclase